MYKRILIATDGSALSKKAVQHGVALAGLTEAELVILKVVPHYPRSYFEGSLPAPVQEAAAMEKKWVEAAQTVVDKVKKDAESKGVSAKAITARSDLVAEAIIAAAKKHKCDLVVMASHGRKGIKRILLGSETQHVLTHSHVPVLVLR